MTVLYLPKELAGIRDQTYILADIVNNTAVLTDIMDLELIDGYHIGARFLFQITRRTDTQNIQEVGEVYVSRNRETLVWEASYDSKLGASGVYFGINQSNLQLQYQATDLTGANYSGTLTVGNKTYIKDNP